MERQRFWTLNKLIALTALAGMATLMIEIRWEHREVLGEQWESWIPLVYVGVMLVTGLAALRFWERSGRQALLVGFALAVVVGTLGVWFHSIGHPVTALLQVLGAWLVPIGQNGGTKVQSAPPVMAPLSFIGVGLIGLFACLRRFSIEKSE